MTHDPDPLLEETTYGQGSYGRRCTVCHADDYEHSGAVVHKPGCADLAFQVLQLRVTEDDGSRLPDLLTRASEEPWFDPTHPAWESARALRELLAEASAALTAAEKRLARLRAHVQRGKTAAQYQSRGNPVLSSSEFWRGREVGLDDVLDWIDGPE